MTAALASCATPAPVATGSPTAGFNQVAVVEHLRVTPRQLLEDSRCPADVQCVWAGTVRLRVEVAGRSGARMADLALGTPATVDGALLALASVAPEKRAADPVVPAAYRFTFAIRRSP